MSRTSKLVLIVVLVLAMALFVAAVATAAPKPKSPYNGKWVTVDTVDGSNVNVRFKFKSTGIAKVRRFDDGETLCVRLDLTLAKSKFRGTGTAVDMMTGPATVTWFDTRCLPRSLAPTAPFATTNEYVYWDGGTPLEPADDTLTESVTGLVFTRAPSD